MASLGTWLKEWPLWLFKALAGFAAAAALVTSPLYVREYRERVRMEGQYTETAQQLTAMELQLAEIRFVKTYEEWIAALNLVDLRLDGAVTSWLSGEDVTSELADARSHWGNTIFETCGATDQAAGFAAEARPVVELLCEMHEILGGRLDLISDSPLASESVLQDYNRSVQDYNQNAIVARGLMRLIEDDG